MERGDRFRILVLGIQVGAVERILEVPKSRLTAGEFINGGGVSRVFCVLLFLRHPRRLGLLIPPDRIHHDVGLGIHVPLQRGRQALLLLDRASNFLE